MFFSDEDMVECPYNKSHLMLRKRLQSHLLKCRLHYPDVELRKCPFNVTHLVPEPEFTHHATNCPDRKLITQYKYDAPEETEGELNSHAPVESEENWDDTDVPDYDPKKYAETATIIRRPEGPTPSERKEFIKKERKRLGDDSSEDSDRDSDVVIVSPAVQADAGRHVKGRHDYDWREIGGSRSRRSSNEHSSRSSTGHRDRSTRSRSPIPYYNRPSTSTHYNRDRSFSGRSSPPRQSYQGDTNSYSIDDDPYYNQSSNRTSSSESTTKPQHSSQHDRDLYNRGSRGSSDGYD